MRTDIRVIDTGLAVWALAWLAAGVVVYSSLKQLEDGGRAVVAAGSGLDETSGGLDRAARGLHETADAFDVLGELPFIGANPGEAVETTADDLERFAVRVRSTGRDARVTGASAEESARTLAVVLGLAVALTPTLPVILLYLMVRPVVSQRMRGR